MKNRKHKGRSLDYPLYEKMTRKSPRAARYWLIGDRLYHLGLFMTMLSMPALFFAYTQVGAQGIFLWLIGLLAGSVGIFALGIYYKRESYKMAIKAGMDINKIS